MKKLIRIAAVASFAFASLAMASAQGTKATHPAPVPQAKTAVSAKAAPKVHVAHKATTVAVAHKSDKGSQKGKTHAHAKRTSHHRLRTNHGKPHGKAIASAWQPVKVKAVPAPKGSTTVKSSMKPKATSGHGTVQRK